MATPISLDNQHIWTPLIHMSAHESFNRSLSRKQQELPQQHRPGGSFQDKTWPAIGAISHDLTTSNDVITISSDGESDADDGDDTVHDTMQIPRPLETRSSVAESDAAGSFGVWPSIGPLCRDGFRRCSAWARVITPVPFLDRLPRRLGVSRAMSSSSDKVINRFDCEEEAPEWPVGLVGVTTEPDPAGLAASCAAEAYAVVDKDAGTQTSSSLFPSCQETISYNVTLLQAVTTRLQCQKPDAPLPKRNKSRLHLPRGATAKSVLT